MINPYRLPPVSKALIDAGHLELSDVLTARTLITLAAQATDAVLAAVALAIARIRQGSVCVDLITAAQELGADPGLAELKIRPWDDAENWLHELSNHVVAADDGPIVVAGTLVYLRQYHQAEGEIVAQVAARVREHQPAGEGISQAGANDDLAQLLARYFPDTRYADQAAAARIALARQFSIITGGPGSGKTTTISRIIAALYRQNPDVKIALAAPTGKAAARMGESIAESSASPDFPEPALAATLQELRPQTLHRLLGIGYRSSQPRHNANYPLPAQVVIVDEVSMVPLVLMQQLLAALQPGAKLILVGDANQLQSVDAGNVLGDLVSGLKATGVVAELGASRRFGGHIGKLAAAVLAGDTDTALYIIATAQKPAADEPTDEPIGLEGQAEHAGQVQVLTYDEAAHHLLPHLRHTHAVASEPNSVTQPAKLQEALAHHRLLCAHRDGPAGQRTWNRICDDLLAQHTPLQRSHRFYVGQPIIVTANDYQLGLTNGDSGIVALDQGEPVAFLDTGGTGRQLPLGRLEHVMAAHALTIHRAQGSQAHHITVVLPGPQSPLLTRELLYTAITRAQTSLTLIGDEASIRAAIGRKARRTTGLEARLRAELGAELG